MKQFSDYAILSLAILLVVYRLCERGCIESAANEIS